MFIEGFKHIKFKEFIEMERNKKNKKSIDKIFSENSSEDMQVSDKMQKQENLLDETVLFVWSLEN